MIVNQIMACEIYSTALATGYRVSDPLAQLAIVPTHYSYIIRRLDANRAGWLIYPPRVNSCDKAAPVSVMSQHATLNGFLWIRMKRRSNILYTSSRSYHLRRCSRLYDAVAGRSIRLDAWMQIARLANFNA